MTDRHAQTSEAIRDSWDFWLTEHSPLTLPPLIGDSIEAAWASWLHQPPVSLGGMITSAIEAAAGKWLASNKDELLDRIANAVASRAPDAANDLGRGA